MQTTTSTPHSIGETTRVPSGPTAFKPTSALVNGGSGTSWKGRTWAYPTAPTEDGVKYTLNGCEVEDPFRGFEVLEAESTQRYIKEQNELSKPLLHSHPMRKQLEAAVEQSYSYERTTCPMRQGDGNYYWLYNPGTSPRDVLVKSNDLKRDFGRSPSIDGTSVGPTVVFDPNLEEDISLYMHTWSPSGRYWTAILQKAGSDWQNIRTIDTETCQAVEDDLTGAKFTFGAAWVNNTGYCYKAIINQSNASQYDHMDGAYGIFYHRLNTPQSEDVLVWHGEGPDAARQIVGRPFVMSANQNDPSTRSWMLWDVYQNTNPETEAFVIELPQDSPTMGWDLAQMISQKKRWISRGYTGETKYVGTLSSGTHLFFSTTDDIEAGRIMSLETSTWDSAADLSLSVIVPPHREGLILQTAHLANDQILILVYLRDACAEVVFADARTGEAIGKTDFKGTRGHATSENIEVPVPHEELESHKPGTDAVVIPKHASISSVSCRSDSDDLYLEVDTYVAPPYVLVGKIVNDTEHGVDVRLDRLDHGDAPHEDLVCREVLYTSHDGVKVPLFINHAHDLDTSRPHPVMLYAYGGSGMVLAPHYNPLFASFMRDIRGIVAVACIRGGGEYGRAWHAAAAAQNRPVAFDDFAYAARYLHQTGLSTPALTSIYGISNGGLLVAACANRNPELYSTVFCDVGCLDMLRFTKFTIGIMWTAEYGDPDNAEHTAKIHAWSPVHNVKRDVEYPSILVTTGDHDTRVIPGHSLKYLAQLQSRLADNKNVFLGRIYENAGHESGSKSVAQRVEEAVDRLVFVLSTMKTEV